MPHVLAHQPVKMKADMGRLGWAVGERDALAGQLYKEPTLRK
jgi:hypothetical protein